MSKALDLANGDLYLGLFAGTASPTFTGVVTVADGSNDINIASHDGTNGLKLAGSLVTSNATELNLFSLRPEVAKIILSYDKPFVD